MIAVITQTIIAACCAFALFVGLRRVIRSTTRVGGRIIGAGFILRSLGGQVLFWVSYLELPFARSLQRGNGLWFYAPDGAVYLEHAQDVIADGALGLLFIERSLPSPFYVQVLALGRAALGTSAAVAMLINLVAFVALCAVVTFWPRQLGASSRRAQMIALCAVSFSPSWVLWSLQPLKDSIALCLAGMFALGCAHLQEERHGGMPFTRRVLASVVLIVFCIHATAGIRWYLAVFMLLSVSMFMLSVVLTSRARARSAVIAVSLLVAGSQLIVIAAEPYLPAFVYGAFRPLSNEPRRVNASPIKVLQDVRLGFDRTEAATRIAAGHTLQGRFEKQTERRPDTLTKPSTDASKEHANVAPDDRRKGDLASLPPAKDARETRQAAGPIQQPKFEPETARIKPTKEHVSVASNDSHTTGSSPVTPAKDARKAEREGSASASSVDRAGSTDTANVVRPRAPATTNTRVPGGGGRPTSAAGRTDAAARPNDVSQPGVTPNAEPVRKSDAEAPDGTMTSRAPAAVSRPPKESRSEGVGELPHDVPRSGLARLGAGTAAVFLPLALSEALQLISVGGGARSAMRIFTECDTVVMIGITAHADRKSVV